MKDETALSLDRLSPESAKEEFSSSVAGDAPEHEHDKAGRDSEQEYPDGGLRAYLVVLGGIFILFPTFGLANTYAVLQASFEQNQLSAYTSSQISWIGATQFFLLYELSLPNGFLFDLGYYQYQLAFGSVTWLVGVFMLSLSREYFQFLLSFGVCMGIGMGSLFSPTLACVGTYFKRKRGVMMALVSSSAAAGSILCPIVLNRTIPKLGFGPSMRIIGYISLGLLALANFVLMRPRKLPPKPIPALRPLFQRCLTDTSTWLLYLGAFCAMIAFFFPSFYIQTYSQAHGANPKLAEYTVAILNAASIPGRIIPGLLSDRFGYLNTSVPFLTATAALVFVMLAATNTAATVVFVTLFGFTSGCWVAMQSPAFMSLAKDISELGFRSGLGFSFIGIASLIGPPICGALVRATSGQYWSACTFAGGVGLVGVLLVAGARTTESQRRKTWKV